MSVPNISLSVLVGRTVPLPMSAPMLTAIESVEVTHSDDGRSGFQLTFLASRGGGFSLDYDLLSGGALQPFNRIVLIVNFGATPRVLMDGLILVPVIMFAFFYPVQVLMSVGAVALVLLVVYESCVIWKRRHPARN